MTSYRRRVEHLEAEVARRGYSLSPDHLWAEFLDCRGSPDSLWRLCQPCLAQLEELVLACARRAIERRALPGAITPEPMWAAAPVGVLAEVVAYPPGEPIAEELLDCRRRIPYKLDEWVDSAHRHPKDHSVQYWNLRWFHSEVAWVISPEPEAGPLRQRLHGSAKAGLNVAAYGQPDYLRSWPDGLFYLVQHAYDLFHNFQEDARAHSLRRPQPRQRDL